MSKSLRKNKWSKFNNSKARNSGEKGKCSDIVLDESSLCNQKK